MNALIRKRTIGITLVLGYPLQGIYLTNCHILTRITGQDGLASPILGLRGKKEHIKAWEALLVWCRQFLFSFSSEMTSTVFLEKFSKTLKGKAKTMEKMLKSRIKLFFRKQISFLNSSLAPHRLAWHNHRARKPPYFPLLCLAGMWYLATANPTQRELMIGTVARPGRSLRPCWCWLPDFSTGVDRVRRGRQWQNWRESKQLGGRTRIRTQGSYTESMMLDRSDPK